MKHLRVIILALVVLMFGTMLTAQAEIIPPRGEGQIGLQAVVLCEKLTMRQNPDPSSRGIKTFRYGDLPIVMQVSGGWAYCVEGDSEDAASGWVNADYIVIDPAWYRTEGLTPVYAWKDTTALRVALLDTGTELPILKEEGRWLIVSLRGAVGWIRKSPTD